MIKSIFKNIIIIGIFLMSSIIFLQSCGPDETALMSKEKELHDSLSTSQAELRKVQKNIDNLESDLSRCEVDLSRIKEETEKAYRGE